MTSKFIMEKFWQEGYNCATVAVIKTALLTFGAEGIFKKMASSSTGWQIVLRDNKKINLSKKELSDLCKGMEIGFGKSATHKGKKQLQQLKLMVRISYAVMLKYLTKFGIKEKKYKLKIAKEYLEDGFGEGDPFNTDHLFRLLGVKCLQRSVQDLKMKDWNYLEKRRAVIIYNDFHVMTMSYSHLDRYGTRRHTDWPVLISKEKALWWYELK